jgi:hypothetical protein
MNRTAWLVRGGGTPALVLAAALSILALGGCAFLMPASVTESTTFADPAGYQVSCTSGPMPLPSSGQLMTPSLDVPGCTRIAEDGVRTFLIEHPGAKVVSVTVEMDAVTQVCYTLDGVSACRAIPK